MKFFFLGIIDFGWIKMIFFSSKITENIDLKCKDTKNVWMNGDISDKRFLQFKASFFHKVSFKRN